MYRSVTRVSSIAIAALVLASTLGVLGAAPASAEVGYAPSLSPATTIAKFADAAAPNGSLTSGAAKRATALKPAGTGTGTAVATRLAAVRRSAAATSEEARARQLLAGYISKYPILAGTTVSFGDARGYQAISYYQSGRIVISKTHSASLERIIAHEIWHIIDWRDNNRIDWGENVPPRQ